MPSRRGAYFVSDSAHIMDSARFCTDGSLAVFVCPVDSSKIEDTIIAYSAEIGL